MNFSIELHPDYWDKPPKIKIDVNNDIMWNGEVKDKKVIEFDKKIPDNIEVKLNIILYDKTYDQTIIKDGKTVKDQLLYISNITIDEIDMEDLVWNAEYTIDTVVKKRSTTLGENGTWCLKFKTPLYLWFLENTFKQT